MSDVSQLIKEYSEITGRPAATLSISEYLELKRYSEITNQNTFINIEETRYKNECSNDIINERVQAMPEKQPKEKVIENAFTEKKEDKKKTVSSALMLMRSING